MKKLQDVYNEIQKILKENNCIIQSEMGVDDLEDYVYLIRYVDDMVEKIKMEGV